VEEAITVRPRARCQVRRPREAEAGQPKKSNPDSGHLIENTMAAKIPNRTWRRRGSVGERRRHPALLSAHAALQATGNVARRRPCRHHCLEMVEPQASGKKAQKASSGQFDGAKKRRGPQIPNSARQQACFRPAR